MSGKNGHIKEFGGVCLDIEKKLLYRDGTEVVIPLKEIELLSVLLERPGELVTKDEILCRVWADSFVEESNLSRHIYLLRKRLKELGVDESVIETVPRRGYRFTGSLRVRHSEHEVIVERRAIVQTLVEELPSVRDSASFANISKPLFAVAVGAILVIGALSLTYFTLAPSAVQSDGRAGVSDDTSTLSDGWPSTTDFGHKWEEPRVVRIQADGKIVVGGSVGDNYTKCDFALARYNRDGSADTTFDQDGKVVTSISERADILYGLTIQPDGKIIAVGAAFTGTRERKFAIVRYKPDGALDASFNKSGIVTLNVGDTQTDTANDVIVLHDGKIVITGSALMSVSGANVKIAQNDFAVVRLNPNGELDKTFGTGGSTIVDFGFGSDVPYTLATDADGRIVVAGMSAGGRQQDFGLARFTANGHPDRSFGTAGRVRTEFFGEDDVPGAVAIQADGKIVLAGSAMKGGISNFAAVRYLADGSLDSGFGESGKFVKTGSEHSVVRHLTISDDGEIVLLGLAFTNSVPAPALVRLSIAGAEDEGSKLRALQIDAGMRTLFGAALLGQRIAFFAGTHGTSENSAFRIIRSQVD